MKKLSFIDDEKVLSGLGKYYELLLEWNEKINLTAITEEDEVYTKHFEDSLAIVNIRNEISDLIGKDIVTDEISLADIGTGAGFPGLVIAVAFKNIRVTLVDSLNKRVDFLNEVISTLGIDNAVAIHSRAEDLARDPDYRENFDITVSRAVARLNLLSEYCLPFVRQGGLFIPYKSGDSKEEIKEAENAVNILGGEISGIKDFKLPQTDIERSLILIKKIENTPKKYPRPAGKASKKPLI